MSIYVDKKKGKPTGRWRVEVDSRYGRYRDRVESLSEAKAKEAEFKRLAAEGIPPPSPDKPVGRPRTAVESFNVAEAPTALPASMLYSKARAECAGRIWAKNPKTEASNQNTLRIIEETMGDVELNGITTAWVMELKEKLKDTRKGKKGEPVKDATINRFLAALSAFLQWAIDKGYRTVEQLPKMEYGDEDEGRIRWFSPEEEATLYRLLPDNCGKAMGISIRTGARKTELLTIKAEQIQNGRIILWGTGTKSGKSRSVPLAPGDEETLRWLVAGNMPTDGELRGAWEKAREAMGMMEDDAFTFHASRHTYATRAVMKRVQIRVLQQLLGHATIKMTERYSHVCDAMKDDAVALMFGEPTAQAA